jgi:hypothetical protein
LPGASGDVTLFGSSRQFARGSRRWHRALINERGCAIDTRGGQVDDPRRWIPEEDLSGDGNRDRVQNDGVRLDEARELFERSGIFRVELEARCSTAAGTKRIDATGLQEPSDATAGEAATKDENVQTA